MSGDDEPLSTKELLGFPNDGRLGQSVFLQTAIREEEEAEVFALPQLFSHKSPSRHRGPCIYKLPKAKNGVLEGLSFTTPSSSNVMQASRYRLANLHCSDSEAVSSSVPSRHDVKRVERKRKPTERETPRVAADVEEEKAGDANGAPDEQWSEFDFDAQMDEDDDYNAGAARKEIHSQTVYKNTCRSLGIFPSSRFYNSLLTGECLVKHQILLAEGVKACSVALLSNPYINKVHFEENEMGPEGAKFIAELLPENVAIHDLTISDNKIGTAGLKSITAVMRTHERISRLDLSGNGFDEADAEYIAEIIESNNALEELVLSHNCFREVGGVTIGKSLGLTDTLKKLNLSWNHLRRKGIIALSKAMEVNHSIVVLDLSWNGVAMEGCKALAKALKINTTIKELDISNGRVNFTCLKELFKGLKVNTCLEILRLSENPITNDGALAILHVLIDNPDQPLKELDIGGQSVDGKFLRKLEDVRVSRALVVHHGLVFQREMTEEQEDEAFEKEDPMMVLMECMRVQNLRLVDLFTSLDKDGSKSLEHAEFKEGLLGINIPMTPKQIDKLIKQLDTDGDGEVDYQELLSGQKEYKRKLHRMKQREKGTAYEETEIGRISIKLRALMAFKQRSAAAAIKQAAESRRMSVVEGAGARGRRNTAAFGLPDITKGRRQSTAAQESQKLRRQSTAAGAGSRRERRKSSVSKKVL